MVVVVGVTTIDEVVAPELQVYEVAPVAIKVAVFLHTPWLKLH
jgi:hypothetical protein